MNKLILWLSMLALAVTLSNCSYAQATVRTVAFDGSLVQQPTNVVVVSPSAQTLQYGGDYIFTGTSAIYTLPAISPTVKGRANTITVKNRGTGNLVINSNGGANTLFGTSLTNTFTLAPGEAYTLIPDGTIINVE